MFISDVLRTKGHQVVTVTPDASVRHLLTVLAEHGIGAVVVSGDGAAVDGIVSERDVVRALAARGPAVLEEPVAVIHTAVVHSCPPDARVVDLMRLMSEHRFRHVPVVLDGRLHGMVSIGDVVKNRIDELEGEHEALSQYISGDR